MDLAVGGGGLRGNRQAIEPQLPQPLTAGNQLLVFTWQVQNPRIPLDSRPLLGRHDARRYRLGGRWGKSDPSGDSHLARFAQLDVAVSRGHAHDLEEQRMSVAIRNVGA